MPLRVCDFAQGVSRSSFLVGLVQAGRAMQLTCSFLRDVARMAHVPAAKQTASIRLVSRAITRARKQSSLPPGKTFQPANSRETFLTPPFEQPKIFA